MTNAKTFQNTASRRPRHQSPAWKRWLSVQAYGVVTRSLFPAHRSPLAMRGSFERFARTPREKLRRKYPELVFEDYSVGERQMEAVKAVQAPSCVLMHLHGGAYFMGTPASYRSRTMRLSYRCNAEVFAPDYRLAPEHPAPAALDDAVDAWCELRRLRPGVPMLVSGDSSGGGLAISMMVTLREQGLPLPDGAVLFSPWTDMTVSGASYEVNDRNDVWLSRAHCETWASYYVGDVDPRDPRVSPMYANLEGLPPMLVLVGDREVLFDDARLVHEHALAAGVASTLHVGRQMQHDWPHTLPWLDESRAAWSSIAGFVAGFSRSENDHAPPQ
ncbi:MAG: alpha/beta hydrolase [Polyangiales bacterium]